MAKKTNASSGPIAAPFLKLVPVVKPYTQYSQECIEAVESLLREAKSGELIGFSIATFYSDRSCDVETIGASRDWSFQTIGLLELLKARLINETDKP